MTNPNDGPAQAGQADLADDAQAERVYNEFAEWYAKGNATNSCNAYYERPATLDLLGEISGKRVLDAGSGPGVLSLEMTRRGASVSAVDVADAMVEMTRTKLGAGSVVQRADLAQPLTMFNDREFDIVVSSLVLHYIKDWSVPLSEFHRILGPGGTLVFSVHHPSWDFELFGEENYFELKLLRDRWGRGDKPHEVRFWRRPLQLIVRPVIDAGFVIERIDEPQPVSALAAINPDDHHKLTTRPAFLFVRAHKAG